MRTAMLLVSAVLVVGCKRYDEQKLRAVCNGTGYEAAAAYDRIPLRLRIRLR